MDIRKLKDSFYQKGKENKEILFNKKGRGYALFVKSINEITWGIPLVSNGNKHKNIFKTINENGKYKGLDYTKAVVLSNKDIGPKHHFKNSKEFNRIKKVSIKIKK